MNGRFAGICLAALLMASPAARADDNAVAHRLFVEGRFAEAAEIFTDPAWKGVAFYRSDQFWRAAEAFVRADDAVSVYNLGNSYAQLGYYELALEAYLMVLARQPGFADAASNADIMRALIAQKGRDGQAGAEPHARKIDELDTGKDGKAQGASQQGDDGKSADQPGKSEPSPDRSAADRQAGSQSSQSRSSAGTKRDGEAGADADSNATGTPGDREPTQQASGGSAATDATASDEAAGARTRLEADQATEQWLNQIADEPARFLKARIALEARRREAAGTAPPAGGDEW